LARSLVRGDLIMLGNKVGLYEAVSQVSNSVRVPPVCVSRRKRRIETLREREREREYRRCTRDRDSANDRSSLPCLLYSSETFWDPRGDVFFSLLLG